MATKESTQKSLHDELYALVVESAEYDHPCDASDQRLDKAHGVVTVQELLELLSKHSKPAE